MAPRTAAAVAVDLLSKPQTPDTVQSLELRRTVPAVDDLRELLAFGDLDIPVPPVTRNGAPE
ncbi:MAG: hypothetical protein ACFFCD_08520 [Promethearchaeota archaeon]